MRGKTPQRVIVPDPQFNSVEISKFINQIMKNGKKTTAQSIVYGAFEIIKKETGKEPVDVFENAMKNISPDVEVKSRRVGGGNYQIPVAVFGNRKQTLAYRWLIDAARARKGAAMAKRLADEIMAAANQEGSAIKKRQDVYKMAEANRAFAHFGRRG